MMISISGSYIRDDGTVAYFEYGSDEKGPYEIHGSPDSPKQRPRFWWIRNKTFWLWRHPYLWLLKWQTRKN